MEKTILYWEKFRSNDCLFQLKIMGIVFRHGIPVLLNRPQRKRKWQTAPVSKTGLAIYYSGPITFLKILPPGWQKSDRGWRGWYVTVENQVKRNNYHTLTHFYIVSFTVL